MDISSEGKSWFMPQWIPKHFIQAWETESILPSKSEALQLLLLAFNISKISPPHNSTECVLGKKGEIPETVYSSRTLIRYFWTFFSWILIQPLENLELLTPPLPPCQFEMCKVSKPSDKLAASIMLGGSWMVLDLFKKGSLGKGSVNVERTVYNHQT